MPPSTPLRQQFQALDRYLSELRQFWQLRPFALRELPWQQHPALRRWLAALDPGECERLEANDQARAEALGAFIGDAQRIRQLAELPPLDQPRCATETNPTDDLLPARLSYHVPGRKWSQLLAFDHALHPAGSELLEWCAGKGHLGRLLAYRRRLPVTSLEWQRPLCEHGQQLADSLDLPCRMQQQDVMQPTTAQWLRPEQHAVALHACGELHLRLLTLASQHSLRAISLAPCCYHLIDDDHYQPLSQAARQSAMQLSKQDLKLALQDTVTAGARERRLRQRELAWRLGFDLLQRQLRNEDSYLPCPSAPKGRLNGDFKHYCQWMAKQKQLALPDRIDYPHFEQQGQQRVATVSRMELVRNLFRRPLELWLVLDRALYLEEQGYQVTLSEFCDYQLTPRNLLIQAVRPAVPAPPHEPGR